MNRSKSNPSLKYITIREFVDYCNANNVQTSRDELELYEKYKLLCPIYRIVYPDDFIRAKYEFKNNKLIGQKCEYEFPDKYIPLYKLEKATNYYNSREVNHILEYGHKLDEANSDRNEFLTNPSDQDYKPWSEYTIVFTTEDNKEYRVNTSKEFYSSWQLFILYDLNQKNTVVKNMITGSRRGWRTLNKNNIPSKLIMYHDQFQSVSEFRYFESLIWTNVYNNSTKKYLTDNEYQSIVTKRKKTANNIFSRHQNKDWTKFIRKLVELYYEYEEDEKIKLPKELKRFLAQTINLVIDSEDISLDQISDECDGPFKGANVLGIIENTEIHPRALHYLFPDQDKQSTEKAKQALKHYIKEFKVFLIKPDLLPEDLEENIIIEIKNEEYDFFLSYIYEIEELWYKRTYRWDSTIFSHLGSIAVIVESIGSVWFEETNLNNILQKAFENYDTFKREIESAGIISCKDFGEFRRKFRLILDHREKNKSRLCGHHLVLSHLSRNFFAHKTQIENIFWDELFPEIYKNFIFTLISLYIKKYLPEVY